MSAATDPPVSDVGPAGAELPPSSPTSAATWAALLTGPVVWITHFMVVYLTVEAACGRAPIVTAGDRSIATVVLAVTGAAALACAGSVWWAWHRHREHDGLEASLGAAGVLLGLGSLASVLAVGLPAVWLEPC
ncbi:MAG: hypothetical protein R2761_00790 [Acidimicrobiales bacterium]